MAGHAVIRRLTRPVPAIVLSLVLLAASVMLTATTQHTAVFDRYYSGILLFNIVGAAVLVVLVAINLWRLVRQFRRRVLGSRLTLRFVATFALLAIVPLALVYYFAVQFLARGIDSWFDVRIENALDDALLLGRRSLDATRQDLVEQAHSAAAQLDETRDSSVDIIGLINDLRARDDYAEMSLFSAGGQIVASSIADTQLFPDTPPESVLAEVRQGLIHSSLEPLSDEGLQLRVVVPVRPLDVSDPILALQILQPLPLGYAKLGASIQSARVEYDRLKYLRGPLKLSFVLTLTLVTLITALIAFWLALLSSRRLAAPLRDLAEGTRAVAHGDYRKQLPVTSSDELGVLVQSFNEMTRQIHRAQSQAHRSQLQAEQQHAYLETVLAHLSSGVLSFDAGGELRTYNNAATQILGVDLDRETDWSMEAIREGFPWVEPLFAEVRSARLNDIAEWQKEITLFASRGRQVLLCRGTLLPRDTRPGGLVIVFDEITNLIQAQRDAAWGEVARRLAHEIKNPLTPIQLSAERIRRKFLDRLESEERETLDRATRTIGQQVENMKAMVNAFSEYAQPVHMQRSQVNLNQLIQDVIELHRRDDQALVIDVDLADDLPVVNADPLRMRQVLNNLVINTRQATAAAERPVMTIRTRHNPGTEPGSVEVVVEDDGPGFPAELLGRIFEPYVTSKPRGTGLGLAIVKRIIDEHGGSIRAENKREGGACITLRLPVDPTPRTVTAEKRYSRGVPERIA